MSAVPHLLVAPVVLPLLAGAACALLGARAPRATAVLSVAATLGFALVAAVLLHQSAGGAVQVMLLGNWAAPFGIALALDRLAALMLGLTALVALLALLYALGGDDRRGRHFHALFQFQLMGLAGAFLTSDLFNLFVFFEVLLAASYGLMLHGDASGRRARLKATVHYVIFNLAGSIVFLVAVGLLYGLTGTLNMADLVGRLAALPAGHAALAQVAVLLLLVVFAVKAALLPLYFWLPEAYAGATAPVAALFAIMTKVGVYAIARTTTLLMADGSDGLGSAVSQVFQPLLPLLALATLLLAAVGALAARRLRLLVAYVVVASAGTLLLAVGIGTRPSLSAGLFYLVHSTLVVALWFLIADRIAAARGIGDSLAPAAPVAGSAWGPLGVAFFVVAVAAAGMPPLAGFFGKALLLQAAGEAPATGVGPGTVVAGVLLASLGVMVALARAGSAIFWQPGDGRGVTETAASSDPAVRLHQAHGSAIVLGLLLVLGVAAAAGPVSDFTGAAARQAFDRRAYVAAVLGARPVPPAYDVRREMRERGDAK
jgi:multicomponent K+:H+ antiporter subunit D